MRQAMKARSEGHHISPEMAQELMWMLSQHHPTHPILKGNVRPPPPDTDPRVLQWFRQVGAGNGLWTSGPVGQHGSPQAGLQHSRQQTAQHSGQRISQCLGQPSSSQHARQSPNSLSPNMIPSNIPSHGRPTTGPPAPQPIWPNSAPNMMSSQPRGYQAVHGRQPLAGMTIEPALANGVAQRVVQPQQGASNSPYMRTRGPSYARSPNPSSRTVAVNGQSVRSPSQPSPHKFDRTPANLPPTPVSFLSAASVSPPTPHSSRPTLTRQPSHPQMGIYAPPLTRPPSVQANAPSRARKPSIPTVDQATTDATRRIYESMKNLKGYTGQLTPRRAKKYAWVQSLNDKELMDRVAAFAEIETKQQAAAKEKQQAAATKMKPPPRPTSTSDESTSKRKTPPTSTSEHKSKKHKPLVITDMPAFQVNQRRLQSQEPNCGFGANTVVIRSTSNTPLPSPQPVIQNFPKILVMQERSPPDVDLRAHASDHGIHMADLEYNSNIEVMLAQRALEHDDLRRRQRAIKTKSQAQVQGPKQVPNARPSTSGLTVFLAEPAIAAAVKKVRERGYDFEVGRDGGEGMMDGVPEGCVRDGDGWRAGSPGWSEERAELEWAMRWI